MTDILDRAYFVSPRKLAVELEKSEEELEQELREHGFTRLTDFQDRESEGLELEYEIQELERRKLQGIFGEKVARFVKGRIKRYIESRLPGGWELRENARLRDSSDSATLRLGEKPDTRDSMKLSGNSVAHYGMDREEILKQVRSRHFAAGKNMFERFQESLLPTIDRVLYALEKNGETEEMRYDVIDHSKSSAEINRERVRIPLEKVEDFKVIGLEVKTSRDDAEKLLSSVQRNVRDRASNSPHIDLYGVHVDYNIDTAEIPEEVPVTVKKLG
ncbi:MAG: hypothetical protein ABEJ07_06315 [Candidatus Nanohaloarchaea archaeon]